MNQKLLILALFSIFLSSALVFASTAWAQNEIDLDQAFQSALRKNESVLIEGARERQTEARVTQSRGELLPEVNAFASAVHQSQATAINGRTARSQDQTSARITAAQPLFTGGRLKSGLERSIALNNAQKENSQATRVSLYLNVAQAFYEVQAAEADLKNLRTSVDLTSGRIKELQRRARIGRSRSGEVLTAQSQLAALEASVQQAESRVSQARQSLAFQTGLPTDTRLRSTVDHGSIAPPLALRDYLDRIETRPDVRSLELQRSAASEASDVARAGHMPTLNLIGNGYWTREVSDRDLEWDVGLGLTIPIFEGGAVQGRVREAKALETEAELLLRQRKRLAETAVTQAHQALSSSIAQIKSINEAVVASEKNYREQTRDYGYGLVTNLDVLAALNTLQENRRSLDRTLYQSLLQWAELRAAVADIPGVKP